MSACILGRCCAVLHNDAASFAIFTENGKYSSGIMASVTLSLYFALSINKTKQVLDSVACKLLHDVPFDLYVNPRSGNGICSVAFFPKDDVKKMGIFLSNFTEFWRVAIFWAVTHE